MYVFDISGFFFFLFYMCPGTLIIFLILPYVLLSDDGKLIIQWSDGHNGVIPVDFLYEHTYSDLTNDCRPSSIFDQPKKYPTLDFSQVSSGEQGVLQ